MMLQVLSIWSLVSISILMVLWLFLKFILLCIFVESAVYSVEEERLWNLVRANCLDFNSWTALIEETERVAAVPLFFFLL
jgi:hypothetical protein